MKKSVLEAIREGIWNFEPSQVDETSFSATPAMPGTPEKIDIMAKRVRSGFPLWHSDDRTDFDDTDCDDLADTDEM